MPGALQDAIVAALIALPGAGEFLRDAAGKPFLRGVGLLIRYDEILYIEVMWHERPAPSAIPG